MPYEGAGSRPRTVTLRWHWLKHHCRRNPVLERSQRAASLNFTLLAAAARRLNFTAGGGGGAEGTPKGGPGTTGLEMNSENGSRGELSTPLPYVAGAGLRAISVCASHGLMHSSRWLA